MANLLGGIHRREVAFTDYFSFREERDGRGEERSVEAVVDTCLGLREAHGTTFFEGKVSDPDARANVWLVEALRDALGPDAMIRIDSNRASSLPTALAPAFEAAGGCNWEDPTPYWREMRRLRRHTRIPFSGHNVDLGKAAAYGVPDALVSDVAGQEASRPRGAWSRAARRWASTSGATPATAGSARRPTSTCAPPTPTSASPTSRSCAGSPTT